MARKKKKPKPIWKSIRRFWSRDPQTKVYKDKKKTLNKKKARQKVDPTDES